MRKENIFDGTMPLWRSDPNRLNGRLIEYGRKWRTKVLPISRFILYWIESTGEFFAQDTVTYKCYLMDRKCPLEKDVDHFLFNHLVKMEESYLEDHFTEFVQIASPEGKKASQSKENVKTAPNPDPYAKWLKRPVNDFGSNYEETKTADQLWDDIPAASPADFSDETNPPF